MKEKLKNLVWENYFLESGLEFQDFSQWMDKSSYDGSEDAFAISSEYSNYLEWLGETIFKDYSTDSLQYKRIDTEEDFNRLISLEREILTFVGFSMEEVGIFTKLGKEYKTEGFITEKGITNLEKRIGIEIFRYVL